MSQIEIPGNISKTRTSQCRSTIRLSWRPPKPRFVKTNQRDHGNLRNGKNSCFLVGSAFFPNHQLPGSSVEPRQTPRFEHQFPPVFEKVSSRNDFGWKWPQSSGKPKLESTVVPPISVKSINTTPKSLHLNNYEFEMPWHIDIQWTYQWHWTQRNWHRFHRIFHPETPSGWGHGPSKLPSKQFSSDLGRRLDEGQI